MVIFGAAASADSILNFAAEPNRPGRSPLSRDLFGQRFDPSSTSILSAAR
jgi:hypothetical protein